MGKRKEKNSDLKEKAKNHNTSEPFNLETNYWDVCMSGNKRTDRHHKQRPSRYSNSLQTVYSEYE